LTDSASAAAGRKAETAQQTSAAAGKKYLWECTVTRSCDVFGKGKEQLANGWFSLKLTLPPCLCQGKRRGRRRSLPLRKAVFSFIQQGIALSGFRPFNLILAQVNAFGGSGLRISAVFL
jgi:hypothetical protein